MPAHKLPLKIEQGATFEKIVTWKCGDPPAPVDITGCTARAHIRPEVASPVVLLELTTENGRIVLGGVEGTIQIYISALDTELITWDSGVYDLEIVFPGGRVVRRLAGGVSVSPEVTRVV